MLVELLILTAAAGAAAILTSVAWHIGQAVWANRLMLRRKVIVNLVGDRAVSGVLWSRRGGLVVLKQAELLEPGVAPVPMDGDVLIERPRIDFIQAAG